MAMDKLKKMLEELHYELAAQLLEKIRSGKATAKDYQVAVALLKHNNITVNASGLPEDDPVKLIKETLEVYGEDVLEEMG
jgi:hypothetical protein